MAALGIGLGLGLGLGLGSGSGLGLGLAQWLCGTRQTRERIRNGNAGRNEAGPRRGGKADWSTWLGLGLGSGSGSGLAEGQGALVKMVDAARARAAVVRPLLTHARVAVRRQIGALELAWATPPDAAAHLFRVRLTLRLRLRLWDRVRVRVRVSRSNARSTSRAARAAGSRGPRATRPAAVARRPSPAAGGSSRGCA